MLVLSVAFLSGKKGAKSDKWRFYQFQVLKMNQIQNFFVFLQVHQYVRIKSFKPPFSQTHCYSFKFSTKNTCIILNLVLYYACKINC